jgi:hypothetical protein
MCMYVCMYVYVRRHVRVCVCVCVWVCVNAGSRFEWPLGQSLGRALCRWSNAISESENQTLINHQRVDNSRRKNTVSSPDNPFVAHGRDSSFKRCFVSIERETEEEEEEEKRRKKKKKKKTEEEKKGEFGRHSTERSREATDGLLRHLLSHVFLCLHSHLHHLHSIVQRSHHGRDRTRHDTRYTIHDTRYTIHDLIHDTQPKASVTSKGQLTICTALC